MPINERIIKVRKTLKLTQIKFGKSLGGFSQSDITNVETGKVNPGIDFLIKLNMIHNVNINWVLLGHEEMFIKKIGYELPDDGPQVLTDNNGYSLKQAQIDIDNLNYRLKIVEKKTKSN